MNLEAFEEKARLILRHQDAEKVNSFIAGCRGISEAYQTVPDMIRLKEKDIKPFEDALKSLKKIRALGYGGLDHKALDTMADDIELRVVFNKGLNTGGRALQLNAGDLYVLEFLRILFAATFPNLPAEYVEGLDLHSLGEALTGKSLSEKVQRLISNLFSQGT
jgi:hypothetical protein